MNLEKEESYDGRRIGVELVILGEDLQSSLYSKVKKLEKEIRHDPNYEEGLLTKLRNKVGANFTGEMSYSQLKRFNILLEKERGKLIGERVKEDRQNTGN